MTNKIEIKYFDKYGFYWSLVDKNCELIDQRLTGKNIFPYFDFYEFCANNISIPELWIVAYEDNKIVGMLKCFKFNTYWSLDFITVSIYDRKKGVGTKLVEALFDLADTMKYSENSNFTIKYNYFSKLGKAYIKPKFFEFAKKYNFETSIAAYK